MNTQDSGAGYAYWTSQDGSTNVIYSLATVNDIDALVNDGFRRIPHGGVESGGFLFGTRNNGIPKIEAFQTIDCQHAFGPSFVLSERDLDNMRSQLRAAASNDEFAGLRPLGWFLGHTRSPFQLNDRELTWFNEFFPQPGSLTLLVKPERFQATRFAVLIRDASGVMERDGTRASFILPLSGQGSGLKEGPAPSIPAPEPPAAAPPAAKPEQAPAAAALPVESAPPSAASPASRETALPPVERSEAIALPAEAAPDIAPSAPLSSTAPAPPEKAVPFSALPETPVPAPASPEEKTAPLTAEPAEKTAPLPPSPFRRSTVPPPGETNAPRPPAAPERTAPLSSGQPSAPDVPRPLGGQVTRIRSSNPLLPSTPPPVAETRPISRVGEPFPASSGGSKAPPTQPPATDPKLAYPYASLSPTRTRVSEKQNPDIFGLRSVAVLLLAAVLGCLAGYWAYLQLPSPVIPVSVREQSGEFLVEWPSAQTNNVDYAALQVNDGQWVTLTPNQKTVGRAVITPPATGDLKIDLLAKHWLRDSRGIVRYIRTPR